MSQEQTRVAFCDDDEDLLFMYQEVAKKLGVVAFVYSDAHELIHNLDEIKPHVIVSDIDMPSLDGFGLLKGLSEIDFKLPFIFLSGHPSSENIRKGYARGAFDFLQKPVNVKELDLAIKKALAFYPPAKVPHGKLSDLLKRYTQ